MLFLGRWFEGYGGKGEGGSWEGVGGARHVCWNWMVASTGISAVDRAGHGTALCAVRCALCAVVWCFAALQCMGEKILVAIMVEGAGVSASDAG